MSPVRDYMVCNLYKVFIYNMVDILTKSNITNGNASYSRGISYL